MSRRQTTDLHSWLDGTSQQARNLMALDPGNIRIDERSDADLLAFVQQLAQHLIFHAAQDDPSPDSPAARWHGFATPPGTLALSVADMAAYIDQPERFSGEVALWLGRPHFALLLTAIALLRHVRDQQNRIVRRHLDHHYRDQLGMAPLPARPDRVAVLFRLSRREAQVLLPAGTLLKAGKDSGGVERVYRTANDLLIQRTRVSDLRTVYVDRRITSLDSLGRETLAPGTQAKLFDQALRLALGDPNPGDPVPPWTDPSGSSGDQPVAVDATSLAGWKHRLSQCGTKLRLQQEELRELMRLHRRRSDDGAVAEWAAINRLMGFTSPPADPRNFMANLEARVGALDLEHAGLPVVKTVDDLYQHCNEKEVRQFIHDKLRKLGDGTPTSAFDRFYALMQIKLRIDAEWSAIRTLLEQAGRRARPGDPSWRMPAKAPTDFAGMLEEALSFGGSNWSPGSQGEIDLQKYNNELRLLEVHFSMPVERLQVLVSAAENVVATPAQELKPAWKRLLSLLNEAHTERFHARRRQVLEKVRLEALGPGPDGPDVFDEVVGRTLAAVSLIPPGGATSRWTWDQARTELARELSTGQMVVLVRFREQLVSPGITPRRFTWADVLAVLEFAQQKIGKVPNPVARKEEWRNLDACADARAQKVDSGRWATFGRRPAAKQTEPPEPNLGFAMRSPLLGLSQGVRTLTLTVGFAADGFDRRSFLMGLDVEGQGAARTPEEINKKLAEINASLKDYLNANLVVRVSGAKGWVPLGITTAALSENTSDYWTFTGVIKPQATPPPTRPALQLVLTAGVSDDPFLAPQGEPEAVLQVLLKPRWESVTSAWITCGSFEPLRLEAIHLNVDVKGLRDLVLQQEDRRLDAHKPFEPFGFQPTVGSGFYLSHPELIRNRLDSLTFHLEWTGLGKKLEDQYRNYGIISTASDFKIQIDLLDRQRPLKLSSSGGNSGLSQSLFADSENSDTSQKATKDFTIDLARNPDYANRPELTVGDDIRRDGRLWSWTLGSPDFGHGIYPALAAAKAQQLAIALTPPATKPSATTTPTADSYRVDPPYTPTLKKLTVDYTAQQEYLPDGELHESFQLLHVHPFGISRILPAPPSEQATLSKSPTLFPRYASAGELYIGLSDTDLPQRLSLLVQLAEGTSNPDLAPGSLRWQILNGDGWTDLAVRQDDTAGFLHSGIVVLDLPAVAPGRWLPAGLTWVKVTIDRDPTSVCDAVDLHAQALMATFLDQGNAADHYATPLAPGSLKALVTPDARIAAIEQPYSSIGGRPLEPPGDLDRRVSEGLRHRQRALAAWDYERLALQEFGNRIHKVKCISGGGEGLVDVIVIPDLRGALPSDPLAPKAPANLLHDVRMFLQDRAPGVATVRVRNPRFLKVKIRLGVRFREGQEERFSQQRLINDLKRFLSPWAFDQGAEISIGGTIYASSIVDFADRLDYVDYVAQIHLVLQDANGEVLPRTETDGLAASVSALGPDGGPDVVLVSAPDHQIDLISELGYDSRSFTGIGYMQIQFDFIVATPPP
jgi:hypothetical protein